MQFKVSVPLAVLLFYSTLVGQSAAPAAQSQMFHVQGTITDPNEAVIRGVKLTFQCEHLNTTVLTNDVGRYDADLPFGDCTMTAQREGFRFYRRPAFRVMSGGNIVLNITLPVGKIIDVVIVNTAGGEATQEQSEAVRDYYGEESFPAQSKDDAQQLYIRYTRRAVSDDAHTYSGEKNPYDDPVFVAYNLFSLQADEVRYDLKSRTIKARGNVVVEDGSGAKHQADSMTFKMENGEAAPLPN